MPVLTELFASENMISFYVITIQSLVGVGFIAMNMIIICFVLGLLATGLFRIWTRITLGVWQ